jgi:hypothetical protein
MGYSLVYTCHPHECGGSCRASMEKERFTCASSSLLSLVC